MTRNVCLLLLAVVAGSGCAPRSEEAAPYFNDSHRDKGLVIVLTGIEGRSPFNEAICEGLEDGGVTWAIDLVDWTTGVPMNYLMNLRDEEHNRLQAREIADSIVRYHMTYPKAPVILVGQSGGGAMAAWIAEALPPGELLEGIIMLAPSLSPGYPLEEALGHTRRGIVNFYSERDWFILGVGTTLSGTMDGQHTSSAGRVGFEAPPFGLPAKIYASKLFQVPWQPVMAETGNSGRHITSGARLFVTSYVAPFVLAEKWDRSFVEMITSRPTTSPASASAAPSPRTRPAPRVRPAPRTPAASPAQPPPPPETGHPHPVKVTFGPMTPAEPTSQPATTEPATEP